EINDIGGTGAVDIGEPDAAAIKQIRRFEPGRLIHRDPGPETAVTQVGPVAHLAITDANQVSQPVARHIGEKDRCAAIGKNELWPLLLVQGLWHPLCGAEAQRSKRGVPPEGVVLAYQRVSEAVAGQVD